MNLQIYSLLLTIGLLVLFLAFLGIRLLRITARNVLKPEETNQSDLLFDTLRHQTLREQTASHGRSQAQQAFSSLEKLHQTVMQHLPIGVLVILKSGRLQFANPSARQIFPELEQQTELGSWCQPLLQTFTSLTPHQTPKISQVNHGTRRLELHFMTLPEEQYLLTVEDVTTLQRLQEQVRTKRDLELMGEMASGITHEVKNALATIVGHVQMLPYGDVSEHSGYIMEEVDNLLDFVRQFMRTSQGGNLIPQPIEVAAWFDEIKSHWKKHPLGKTLVITAPDPDLVISGERVLLTTVINNLILNGAQSGGFGCVPEVRLTTQVHDAEVVVVVEDDGPGFPPEVQVRMFSPFVSSKAGGTGLGLFQCRKIMMEHQGSLTVEQGPPTRVICHFPKDFPPTPTPS